MGAAGWMSLTASIISHWRRGIYWMVSTMPFFGLLTIFLYPAPFWTRLVKDVCFVIPGYIGFLLWWVHPSKFNRKFSARLIVWLVAVLSAIVIMEAFNRRVPNGLVAIVGIGTWLLHLPMMFLGYYLLRSREELVSFAKLVIVSAVIPSLFGVAQAIAIYTGHDRLAYALYGKAAPDVTQGFARFIRAGGDLGVVRIASIFPFVTQYSFFLISVLPFGFGLIARKHMRRASRFCIWTVVTLVLIGSITCGSRSVFVIVPGMSILAAVLARNRRTLSNLYGIGVLLLCSMITMTVLLGTGLRDFGRFVWSVVAAYLSQDLWSEYPKAISTSWFGVGVGLSTGPARFAVGKSGIVEHGVEAYFAKALMELGIMGFIIVVLLVLAILMAGYRALKRLKDSELRIFGGGVLALLVIIGVYFLKGSPIDYDPLNVYYWLFAGILLSLPRLQAIQRENAH
jgi:hypothetical protein